MRILLVTPLVPPESGGPSYYSVALRDAFLKKGHEVRFFAFKEVRSYPSGLRHLLFFWIVFQNAFWAERVIALDTWSVALPAVLAARLARKSVYLRSGGDFVWEEYIKRTGAKTLLSEFYQTPRALSLKERVAMLLLCHVIFRLATKIIFSTAWQRDISVPAYHIPIQKTAVIENQYGPKMESVPPVKKNFVCVYRPTPFKNIGALREAFTLVSQKHSEASLEIYENIPRDEAFEHMRRAYAIIIPSLSEVSPNVAIEALQFGKPCILTRDCGMRDRLGDAPSYVDPNDSHTIAASMEALLDDSFYGCKEKAAQAFSFVHTYDAIAEEFIELL